MKRYLYPVVAAAVVLAIVVGVQLIPRAKKAHAPSREVAADGSELDALRRQVQALESEVRSNSLRTRTIEAVQVGAAVDAPRDRASHEDSSEPPETKEEAQQRRAAYIAKIEHGFQTEVSDRNWAPMVTKKIDEALHAEDVGMTAKAVECRSTSCRVELPWDVTGGMQKNLPVFLNRLGQPLPSTIAHQVDDGHGGQNTVVFMFRNATAPSDGEPG